MRPASLLETGSHHPAGGDASGDGRSASGGVLVKLVSSDKVHGQRDLYTVLFCFGHQVLDNAGPFLIVQRRTDLTNVNMSK